jgi:hypothetical protein
LRQGIIDNYVAHFHFAEVKESAKETATGAKEKLEDTGSRIAEKGRGKFLFNDFDLQLKM